MMHPQAGGDTGVSEIEKLHNTAINAVEFVCSIIAMPVEMIFRPWYGTRYFAVPVVFCSTVLMIVLPAFTALAGGAMQMIPFTHIAPPRGMFDIGSLASLYFLLSAFNSVRLYRRMMKMETEIHSRFEGPALPFFALIPKGDHFWFCRIVLEPAVVFLAATILKNFLIVQPGLAIYLDLAAFALAMKNFIGWYRAWEFLRGLLDMRAAGPIVAKLIENTATEMDLAPLHLPVFPKNISPDLRRRAAMHIARIYTPVNDDPTDERTQGDSRADH
jgi:hypothetical protein